MATPARSRLDVQAWVDAALAAVAEDGLASVAVESLARRLGTTKGSFYWHFPNRDALVLRVLEHWESIATAAVISRLDATADPLDRLARLSRITNRSEWEDRLEYAILSAADDPLVHPFVERVTADRTRYVARIFRDLGYPSGIAELRSTILMHAYVGRLRLQHGRPRPTRSKSEAYNRELVRLLTSDRLGGGTRG